ncbi:hypothetical protein D3C80_1462380 [compost metagenome]
MGNTQGLQGWRRRTPEPQALEQPIVLNRQTGEKNQRDLLIQPQVEPAVECLAARRRTAGHPGQDAGIQATETLLRQRSIRGQVIHPVAQVFQQPTQQGMPGAGGQVTLPWVVQQRNSTWLNFDVADAQGVQLRRANVRNEPLFAQALGQLAGFVTTGRRQVLDRHQWRAFGSQGLQLGLQPLTIRLGHRPITLGSRIPARVD